MSLNLDIVQSVAFATIVLLIGKVIKGKVNILNKYCIPAPVIGGFLFAILALVLKQYGILSFVFDSTLRKILMTAFFTTVGFTASFAILKKGGIKVAIFLGLAVVLVALQNVVGVTFAKVFNINPLIGLLTGSVPMTGGHGTSGAFGPLIEEAGVTGGTAIAMASATFGLVIGSIIGGPLAKKLIEKHKLTPDQVDNSKVEYAEVAATSEKTLIPENFASAAFQIIIAMGLGTVVSSMLKGVGLTLPSYIGAMFVAAVMRNISDLGKSWGTPSEELDILGGISLSLFLAMTLSGLRLWELADLAIPMVTILVAQTLLMATYAYFVTFNIMGRDYTAAVVAGGHCGFGMGATPNAIANMESITGAFGPAPAAFFILPLVGALFIDFFNAAIITTFMNIFG
ncbi:MAG: sodium/glutamate symporter [Marinisporobacter sp.]|nr:sodium/glutamate symporter [Marinisporobacter sp.]